MVIAKEMAKKQKEISISEFFSKNRHLLGFDNPTKALLTAIKEAVDNSLDACEEARILPDIYVEVKQVRDDRYIVIVEDNGPGIVKEQIAKIFGKLLYGSKFHKLSQTRGQQGIGISAAAMYGQLTTGNNIKVVSKISPDHEANFCELHLDTTKNEPKIVSSKVIEWAKDNGTRLELELEAKYQKGKRGIDEYLKQTAVANPHVQIDYLNPVGERFNFARVIHKLPIESKEIKPHPYGVELGMLIRMLQITKAINVSSFLQKEFSRVSAKVSQEILDLAGIFDKTKPKSIARDQAEKLYNAINKVRIIAPPTNCLSPIGEENLLKGLKKEVDAEFYASATRPPAVYRGNPFQIEVAIAYGGSLPKDGLTDIVRFANKVPLQYQQGACSISKSILDTAWKNYGLSQSRGALPQGPLIIILHIASVWVPFTSESKEAVAHYPEIIKEMKRALQDCGRKLGTYMRSVVRLREQKQKASLFKNYSGELAMALSQITNEDKEGILTELLAMSEKFYQQMNDGEKKDEK
jgi:DNA topoisomerase VI subunit B